MTARRHIPLLLLALMLAALFLRVWKLDTEAPWGDEVASLRCLDATSLTDYLRREREADPMMMPTYFTLQYLWSRVAGTTPYQVRLLSVMLGVFAIPLLYALGRRMAGAAAGFAAAFLLTVSLYHVYMSQEARMYIAVFFLALCSVYALVRALEPGASRTWWALHWLANAAVVFGHLLAVFLIAAQGLYLLIAYIQTRRNKGAPTAVPFRTLAAWIAAQAIIVAATAVFGWLFFFQADTAFAVDWIEPPTPRSLMMMLLLVAGGRPVSFPSHYCDPPARHLPGGLAFDIPLAIVLTLLASYGVLTAIRRRDLRGPVLLLTCWLAVPPLLLLALSCFKDSFVVRYVFYIAPAFYLLAAIGLTSIPRPRVRTSLTLLIAFIAACHAIAVCAHEPFRPDWRALGRHLAAHAKPGDVVLVGNPFDLLAMRYNAPPLHGIESRNMGEAGLAPAVQDIDRSRSGIWMAVWPIPPTPGQPRYSERFLNELDMEFTVHQFPGWPTLMLYEVPRKGSLQ